MSPFPLFSLVLFPLRLLLILRRLPTPARAIHPYDTPGTQQTAVQPFTVSGVRLSGHATYVGAGLEGECCQSWGAVGAVVVDTQGHACDVDPGCTDAVCTHALTLSGLLL